MAVRTSVREPDWVRKAAEIRFDEYGLIVNDWGPPNTETVRTSYPGVWVREIANHMKTHRRRDGYIHTGCAPTTQEVGYMWVCGVPTCSHRVYITERDVRADTTRMGRVIGRLLETPEGRQKLQRGILPGGFISLPEEEEPPLPQGGAHPYRGGPMVVQKAKAAPLGAQGWLRARLALLLRWLYG